MLFGGYVGKWKLDKGFKQAIISPEAINSGFFGKYGEALRNLTAGQRKEP
jgi:hypothetical protein